MKKVRFSKSEKETMIYFALTLAFTWLVWLPAAFVHIKLPISPDFFIKAGSFVPSLTGIALTVAYGGIPEIRMLFRSMLPVRDNYKWLLFSITVLPVVSALSCLVYIPIHGNLPQPQYPIWFIPFAFVYILVLMGPLGEEAGWRGFALRRLLKKLSPFAAAMVLGFVWTVWHMPLFFIRGTVQYSIASYGLLPALFGYFLYTLLVSCIITFFYIISGGNVFGSIIIHTAGNLSLGYIPIILTESGAVILLVSLCAVCAGFLYGYRSIMFRQSQKIFRQILH